MPVQKRVGQSSYEVLLKPNTPFQTHRDRMKPFVTGDKVDLYHFAPGYRAEGVGLGEWNVEKILDHRFVDDKVEFFTQWDGFEQGPMSWEPVGNFIHRYAWKPIQGRPPRVTAKPST